MVKEEKVLTRELVEKLGLNKLSVITADMISGYTSIEREAFYGCNYLTSVTIPNSVTSIGDWAFEYCHSLASVTIPNSVTSIGDMAFYDCSSLISVTIPNSITSIGRWVFEGCSSLPVVDNLRYADTYLVEAVDKTLSSYTIKNGTKWIGYYAFCGCSSLASVTIPNSVTSIDHCAFQGCSSLTSVTIPNSVTSIGNFAFYGCNYLTSVTIPNSVTSIGDWAFKGCNFKVKKKTDKQGRIIAYKAFKANMTCRGFQYKEGETYEIDCEPIICERGFHACLTPLYCLNYYWGKIGIDAVFHEVYLDGVPDSKRNDSKVVARKITIGREISPSEMADIASGRK